jgi:hypothetical protein
MHGKGKFSECMRLKVTNKVTGKHILLITQTENSYYKYLITKLVQFMHTKCLRVVTLHHKTYLFSFLFHLASITIINKNITLENFVK